MSARIRVALTGDRAMKGRLEGAVLNLPKVARTALKEWAEEKLAIATERAPEKTGKLKRSGKIRVMIRKRKTSLLGHATSSRVGDFSASIVFGGPDVLYARKVHETHKTHSKFLERTVHEAVPTAGPELAAKLDLKGVVPR